MLRAIFCLATCNLITRPKITLHFENDSTRQNFISSFYLQQRDTTIDRNPLNKSNQQSLLKLNNSQRVKHASDDTSLPSSTLSPISLKLNQFKNKSNESNQKTSSSLKVVIAHTDSSRPLIAHHKITLSQDRTLWRRATSKFRRESSYTTPVEEKKESQFSNMDSETNTSVNNDFLAAHKRKFQDISLTSI